MMANRQHSGALKQIDATITIGEKPRIIEPLYYDRSLFGVWNHSVHGWGPAADAETQRTPGHDTDVNQFHLAVENTPYKAEVRVGPKTQKVRVWKDAFSFEDADESTEVLTPFAPYVVFLAVLQDPEQLL